MTDDAERTVNLRPEDGDHTVDLRADDAEGTVDLRPDDRADRSGAAVAPRRGTTYDSHVSGRRGRSERTVGRDLLASGILAVILTALGLPFAMLWQIVTPRVEYVVLDGGWASVETYPRQFVEGDLIFAAIGLVFGIVAAALAWGAMSRSRGPIVLLGLVIGSIACQVVAWKIGAHEWQQFWDAVERAPVGSHMWRPPSVLFVELDPAAAWRAIQVGNFTEALGFLQLGALAVMALAATFTYTVCAGWSRRPSLRTDAPE
ncbi:DUF2567 domain-containing protein [Glycomyces sp. TRM65418]|uniref:DUF2567 domain-containing protein n=1 Tax=Glycomyces sp. TRM65418 TaxID=2867006 RepID=UPI001CE4D950|nr:DUF2567 domain-containing protein [Glycomyces sp. TRM65418]MCC3762062.1 DUF2567 domain-containing protein [Glycomyces sp. TRM65418]QZD56132.1 DUF2567 domain-containing protein [Glycomyces sp. TRM65418]